MGGLTKSIGNAIPMLQPLDMLGHDYRSPEEQGAAEKKRLDDEAARAELDRRTETAQEALDSRTRAGGVAAQFLGGQRRKASQSLTDPGATLSGSY